MRKRGWPLSMLDEIVGAVSGTSNPTKPARKSAIPRSTYRYAYADDERLANYRARLSGARPR